MENASVKVPAPVSNLFLHVACLMVMGGGLVAPSLKADDFSDRFRFSGFATLAASKLNRHDVQFFDSTGDWSLKSDTVLGGQLQFRISDRWSTTTQVVARGFNFDGKEDFEPVVNWLFLAYQATPSLRFRFGRMRTPYYMYSESAEIGFSYPWVRPPVDNYIPLLRPITNFDGVDLGWKHELSGWELDVQVFAGQFEGSYFSTDMQIGPEGGVSLIARKDNLKLRYAVTLQNLDISSTDLLPVMDGFRQFSALDPVFDQIADSHVTRDAFYQYHALGMQYDWRNVSVIAEHYLIWGPDTDFTNRAFGGFVSLTCTVGRYTPYLVFGHHKNLFADEIGELLLRSETVVPPGTMPPLDDLRALDRRIIRDFNDHGFSYTGGLRVELARSVAMKAEWQYFDSNSHFREFLTSSEKEGGTLLSLAVDMVF